LDRGFERGRDVVVEFFGALQRTAKPLEFKFAGGDLSGSN
jgi:hypothetical protein